MLNQVKNQAGQAMQEFLHIVRPSVGKVIVIGCSTSEIVGRKIGSNSNLEIAEAVFDGIYPHVLQNRLYLTAQCCEHLNRAIILEQEAADKLCLEKVNVLPKPKAGGSFAATCWRHFHCPVAVEHIQADYGMDIGLTLIGMHLKSVVVPVRLSIKQIGRAEIVCARTRLKFIGGQRACYQESDQ